MTNSIPNQPAAVDPDALARERIVKETGGNFFVEAGAGSGKTTLLVHRMTAMVENGTDISRICAITFTKNAANEFYERFRDLLSKRSRPETAEELAQPKRLLPPTTEESRLRCAEALKNIDLCFMGTIDAFCNRILSEHPAEAGLPAQLRLGSEEEIAAFLRQAYVRLCHGDFGTALKQQADLLRKLSRRAEEIFTIGAAYLLSHRNVTFAFDTLDTAEAERRMTAYAEELRAAVNALVQHPEAENTKTNADHRAAWAALRDIKKAIDQNWDYRYDSIVEAAGKLKGLRISGEPEEIGIAAGNIFKELILNKKKAGSIIADEDIGTKKDLEFPLLKKMRDLLYDAALSFLTACLPQLEEELRGRGLLTYFDYLFYLRNMLRDDAGKGGALTRYIVSRHAYYLIDEFQDTDPLQAEVFFHLAAETPQQDWSHCRPRAGSLFIVGDPKQSIYRFRNADVSSFQRVKDLFGDPDVGEVLALSRNFRSTVRIRRFFNDSFSVLLPAPTVDQSCFEPIPVGEDEKDPSGPEIFGGVYRYPAYIQKKGRETHPEETDEKQIVRIIRQLTGHPEKYKLNPPKEDEPRAIRYADFMVITAMKAVLPLYMREMEAAGIPFRVEGSVPFAESPALSDVIKIFTALADPRDKIALYRALRCGVIGLKDGEIETLFPGGSLSLRTLKEAEPAVQPIPLQRLSLLHKESKRLSPSALFERITEEYRVFETDSDQNAEILWFVLEKLRSGEAAGLYPSHKKAAVWLETLLTGEPDEERTLSLEPQKNAVHLANLHKVKGLEAPIVILAAAQKPSNKGGDSRIEYLPGGTNGYLFNLKKSGKGFNKPTVISTKRFEDEAEAEKISLSAERERHVYVGATRAGNALIISESRTVSTSGKESISSKWEALLNTGTVLLEPEEVPAGSQPEKTAIPARDLYRGPEESIRKLRETEWKAGFEIRTPSRLELISRLDEAETDLSGEPAALPEEPAVFEEEPAGMLEGAAELTEELVALPQESPEPTEEAAALVEEAAEPVEEAAGAADKTASAEKDPSSDPSGLHHRLAAVLGTMAHRLMEMLVSSGFRLSTEDAVREILQEYGGDLPAQQQKALCDALRAAVKTMLSDGYPQENGSVQDLFGELKNAEEIHCELPFTYRDDAETPPVIWDGVMDLVYKKDGRWFIVDYKTNADGSDLDVHYRNQLEAYKKAFSAMTGEEAETRIYHLAI